MTKRSSTQPQHETKRYWANCFWLMLPILALNLALWDRLPALFSERTDAVPAWLSFAEAISRTATLALPALMPFIWDRRGKLGLSIYALGLLLYALSWLLLIAQPPTPWAQTTGILLAPAVTPALWLAGIALIGDRRYHFLPLPAGTYVFTSALFLCVHISLTLMIITQG